jgi:hypothetical protein
MRRERDRPRVRRHAAGERDDLAVALEDGSSFVVEPHVVDDHVDARREQIVDTVHCQPDPHVLADHVAAPLGADRLHAVTWRVSAKQGRRRLLQIAVDLFAGQTHRHETVFQRTGESHSLRELSVDELLRDGRLAAAGKAGETEKTALHPTHPFTIKSTSAPMVSSPRPPPTKNPRTKYVTSTTALS